MEGPCKCGNESSDHGRTEDVQVLTDDFLLDPGLLLLWFILTVKQEIIIYVPKIHVCTEHNVMVSIVT